MFLPAPLALSFDLLRHEFDMDESLYTMDMRAFVDPAALVPACRGASEIGVEWSGVFGLC